MNENLNPVSTRILSLLGGLSYDKEKENNQ